MSVDHEDAFTQGREDGFTSGLAGEAKAPEPDPILAALDLEYEGHYQQGAALGFVRGKERREMVRRRAEQQIKDREK
ncbi:hypothetical protein [Nioella sp. MMSF_3534]|uniref:hypothetical protein n=1 Tax=Nioella sp. MMSF_3534 TaxID=3046720 RepID=UPI00273F819C|nr:hypothetical protein [Nioella sp. MMSF_3534]